jgi:hypothetical protein
VRGLLGGLALLLVGWLPSPALACPACAGRDGPAWTTWLAVGGMILAPYAVAIVALRVMRRLDRG